MMPVISLGEIRTEVLSDAEMTGNTNFQALVDSWTNRELARLYDRYTFREMLTDWHVMLPSTAPTPHTWAPAELTGVPRDMMDLIDAYILDTSVASDQKKVPLQILPRKEAERMIRTFNPPTSSRPSWVFVRRREGVRHHQFDPRTGDTGIRVTSSATEAATLTCAVTYYADANRTDIRKAVTTTGIDATPITLVAGLHYGIVSVSLSANASGRITIDHTAGTNVYAVIQPWDRIASYTVLAFNSLTDAVNTDEFHCTYKRWCQYLSQPADVVTGMPMEGLDLLVSRVRARALRHEKKLKEWREELTMVTSLERDVRRLALQSRGEIEEPHMVLDDYP